MCMNGALYSIYALSASFLRWEVYQSLRLTKDIAPGQCWRHPARAALEVYLTWRHASQKRKGLKTLTSELLITHLPLLHVLLLSVYSYLLKYWQLIWWSTTGCHYCYTFSGFLSGSSKVINIEKCCINHMPSAGRVGIQGWIVCWYNIHDNRLLCCDMSMCRA